MKTNVTNSPGVAAEYIRSGGIVAFPTETVYGLGANVFDPGAVAKIFEAKRRPSDNPLIAHVANLEQIRDLSSKISGNAQRFIDGMFPGPLTIVFPKSARVPLIATAGLDTIGVRMPNHDLARSFLDACETPVVAPSANLSGKPSPTTWQAVLEDLDGRIDCILQGEATEIGLESTVVDCSTDIPILLRMGAVSLEQLCSIVPETIAFQPVVGEEIRSPGLKHKHYSPMAEVVIVGSMVSNRERVDAAYIGLRSRAIDGFSIVRICSSTEEYAHEVFEFFRECDRAGISTIYCEEVPETGIGSALMDRLRRAGQR